MKTKFLILLGLTLQAALSACGGNRSPDSQTYANPAALPQAEIDALIKRAERGDPHAYWELYGYYSVQSEQEEAQKWLDTCVRIKVPRCVAHVATMKTVSASILKDDNPRKRQLLEEARSQMQIAIDHKYLDRDFDVNLALEEAAEIDRDINELGDQTKRER